MTDEDADVETGYEPSDPAPPERAPPLRQTAPQSPFTRSQVLIGFLVHVLGLLFVFAIPFLVV